MEEKGFQWGLLNIYAPNHEAERRQFWEYIRNPTPSAITKWVVGGDFNMVEDPCDWRGGRLTTIHGQEVAKWEKLIFQMNLTDTWHLRNFSRERLSLRFSRSSLLSPQSPDTTTAEEASSSASRAGSASIVIVESRLGRFYVSTQIADQIGSICIQLGTTLSDHDPVILRLKGPYQGCPRDQRNVRIPNKFLSKNGFKQDLGNIWATKMHLEGNMATKVAAALTASSQFLKEKVHLKELQLAEKEKNIR